jgi:predicted nucleic acid-binding protein
VCDLELASSLRGLVRARLLPGARADEALALYLSLPLERHDHRALIGRVWALRSNFTAYDAAYVALAEALEAAVLTFDDTLARAIVRHSDVAVVGA